MPIRSRALAWPLLGLIALLVVVLAFVLNDGGSSTTTNERSGEDQGSTLAGPTVDRVPLTRRIPSVVREACRTLRQRTQVQEVVCPSLLPRGRYSVIYRGPLGGSTLPATSYVLDLQYGGPRRHVVFEGGPPDVMRRFLYPASAIEDCRYRRKRGLYLPFKGPCGPRVTYGSLEGRPIAIYRFPMLRNLGTHAGHVLVTWGQDGARYAVSVHGRDNVKTAKALAEATMKEV
jgi:hypothetical protein